MTLYLPARGLLSKWGFNDGDEPDGYYDWREAQGLTGYHQDESYHDALEHLVRTRLLPLIPNRVELVRIETIHNPIRADRVDGIEVDHYADTPWDEAWADVYVEVPYEDVLRASLMQQLRATSIVGELGAVDDTGVTPSYPDSRRGEVSPGSDHAV